MKQDAFPGFDANWLAMAQHTAVNGERSVADLKTMRHALRKRCIHQRLTTLLQLRDGGRWKEKILIHIAATAEGRLKLLQGEKDLAIIVSGLMSTLNIDRPDLSAVQP